MNVSVINFTKVCMSECCYLTFYRNNTISVLNDTQKLLQSTLVT